MTNSKTCRFCGYSWIPRKPMPIECPACKRYFYIPKRKAGKIM